jgi:hypothetical protein
MPLARRHVAQALDVLERVHAQQLLVRGGRSVTVHQEIVQTLRMKLVLDRAEAGRSLRVAVPHLVTGAAGMRDESSRHADFPGAMAA